MDYVQSPSWATVCNRKQQKIQEEYPVLILDTSNVVDEPVKEIVYHVSEEPLKPFTSREWFRWYKSWRDMLYAELNILNDSLRYYEMRRGKISAEKRITEIFDIRWRISEVNKELSYVKGQVNTYRVIVTNEYEENHKNDEGHYEDDEGYEDSYEEYEDDEGYDEGYDKE